MKNKNLKDKKNQNEIVKELLSQLLKLLCKGKVDPNFLAFLCVFGTIAIVAIVALTR